MNAFDSFFRFFPLSIDSVDRPINTQMPDGKYPALPVIPTDRLRFLVNPADCWGVSPNLYKIGIRAKGLTTVGTVCGLLRKQAGAMYTEIRIRINAAATAGTYSQFAIMLNDSVVMQTFRGQQTDIMEYVMAVCDHFKAYPYALTEVDCFGQEIRIRFYPNDRLSLHGEKLRIGLGTVTQKNVNSPSLMAQKTAGLVLPAEDLYRVAVSDDIQKGNIYTFEAITYEASGTEKPADIITALGIAGNTFTRTGGTSVLAYSQPGSQTIANTNKPTFQLLFDTSSGGTDRYIATVGVDVQAGNVYQVSAVGSTTKTVTATSSDTASTIAAQFNVTSGRFSLPAGSVPTVTVFVGSQIRPNTNNPVLTVLLTQALGVRTVDRYTVYVGSSVVQGNQYELTVDGDTTTVQAAADETPVDVAERLGYTTNPFQVDVTPGTAVLTIAKPGPRYNETDNTADITLLSARTYNALPYVAEINLNGTNVIPGTQYQFTLINNNQVFAVSNYVTVKSSAKDTALVRYGTQKPGSVFGLVYAEDGLMQQIRLPIFIDSSKLKQAETLYATLDNTTVRGRTSADVVRSLTTTTQGEAFHRNMWMALKHPLLTIDNKAYRCEGEYSQTEPQIKSRDRQATAELTEIERFDYRPTFDYITDSITGNYASISEFTGWGGLWFAVKRLSFVEVITAGMSLPAADYDLLIRAGADPIRLTVANEGIRVATFLLKPGKLNHIGPVRFAPGRMSLIGEVVATDMTGAVAVDYNPQDAEATYGTAETISRTGDFNEDFNADYFK